MDKALIYKYNKECYQLLRYRDSLRFGISGIYDEGRNDGVDAGIPMGIGEIGVRISANLDLLLSECDITVITGDCPEDHYQVYLETVYRFLRSGKKILSCYDDLRGNAKLGKYLHAKKEGSFDDVLKKYGSHYEYYTLDQEFSDTDEKEIREKCTEVGYRVPVIGVWGTSSCQGKFTTQIRLKKGLTSLGILTGFISTEPTGRLLGADYEVCRSAGNVSRMHRFAANRVLFSRLERSGKKCVIVGGQSFLLPMGFRRPMYFFPMGSSPLVSAKIFLYLQPDLNILIVNPDDPLEYVRDSMDFMRYLNGSDTVGLCLMDGERKGKLYEEVYVKMDPERLTEIQNRFRNGLGIGCYVTTRDGDMDELSLILRDRIRQITARRKATDAAR
jgi:uncharacterized NAD-dependent epimerase/dehydratase family protein